MREWLTVKDLVQMGIGSQAFIYNLFNSTDTGFPGKKIMGNLRVRKIDLDKWLDKQQVV